MAAQGEGPGRRGGRRSAGEGTLYFDAKAGLWRGELMVGRRLDGRRDIRKVSAKTQKACRERLQQLRQEHATAALRAPGPLTVEAFFLTWLEGTVKLRRKPSTYAQYRSLLTVHALPALGRKPLRDVEPQHLEALYRALETGGRRPGHARAGRPAAAPWGLAPKSIRGLHIALHSGFERAVRQRLIPRNPADGVELPRAPRRRRPAADVEAVQTLLASSAAVAERRRTGRLAYGSAQWAALWAFLANTGLRLGEALALRWSAVDLAGGWFLVAESLGRGPDGGRQVGDPKTEAGERHAPLTDAALAALRAHRERQEALRDRLGPEYADHDQVFATAAGTPLSQRNTLRAFKAAAGRAGLPADASPHDLRRMTASLLVASGIDLATAASILGHKNASVLLDVYARALRESKRDAAGRLQRLLYGPPSRVANHPAGAPGDATEASESDGPPSSEGRPPAP